MTQSLFQALFSVLTTSDRLTLMIQPETDDRMRVTVLPQIDDKGKPDDADDPLRAALSMPLTLAETPENLDQNFTRMLREYATQRAGLGSNLSALERLREANADATAKLSKKKTGDGKKASSSGDEAAPEKPRSSAVASDDDILL